MSRNQLIVQLPVSASSDFDASLQIEETLIQAFEQNRCAVVDGHDIGQGKFNIFIFPKASWAPVIQRVKAFLELRGALGHPPLIAAEITRTPFAALSLIGNLIRRGGAGGAWEWAGGEIFPRPRCSTSCRALKPPAPGP